MNINKKSILFVCIGTNVGGIEKSLINLLNTIDYKKYDVDLLLWEKPGELYSLIPNDVCIIDRGYIDVVEKEFIHEYSWYNQLFIVKRYFFKKFFNKYDGKSWKSSKSIKKRYDIAIAYSQNDFSGEYVIDKTNSEKKYLWFHHGSYDFSEKKCKFNEEYYPKFDSIIAVSDSCKKELLKIFPMLETKIKVVYNQINREEIINKASDVIIDKLNINGKCIVTVGRISEEKGTDIAIEVANKLKNKGYSFTWIFVGKGTLWDEIVDKIKKYDLQDVCLLVGAKSNPYSYMKMADIYIQPSKVESFGLTVGEAKILGKSIIASNLPEIKKQLLDYENSKLINLSVSSLYSAIVEELNTNK